MVLPKFSVLLADEYALYTKTRNYHWYVIGPQFHDYHKFFESQYEELDDIVDAVAERGRTVGGQAVATLPEFQIGGMIGNLLTDPVEHPGHNLHILMGMRMVGFTQ